MSIENETSVRRFRSRDVRAALVGFVAAVIVVGASPPARADVGDDIVHGISIAYDVAILRPLNAAATVLGTGFFLASLPLVAPFEGISTSWDVFVYAPYEYTVVRDLGDF